MFQNILIVRTDRIGDVVLTTPAVRALKTAWPSARVTMLVAPATRELVDGNPFIDEVMVDERKGRNGGFIGYLRLIRMVRSHRFDLAVVFHTKKRTNLLCFAAGIPVRLGYRDSKHGFLLTHPVRDERPEGRRHEARYCLELLQTLGIESDDLTPYVAVAPANLDWARHKFNTLPGRGPLIAVHPAASDPAKMWPAERFIEVLSALAGRGEVRFVVIGDSRAQEPAGRICRALDGKVLDLSRKTSVGQLAGVLKQCDLLISNDTGPVHMADALGVPVVSIFTRNQPGLNPERWSPLSSRSIFVAPPAEFGGSRGGASSQVINSQQVLDAVDAVFKLC